MTFTEADSLSVIAFVALISLVVASIIIGTDQAAKRLNEATNRVTKLTAIVVTVIFALTTALVLSGWMQVQPFPRVMFFFLAINISAVVGALSPWGKRIALGLPLSALIAFQSFRLPLELILHDWAAQRVIPSTMTWTGQNFDIVTGVLATIGIFFRTKWYAWFFNIVGTLLLLNVMRVVVFSSPFPFSWEVDPPIQLAFHLPYAFIGPFGVGAALLGHVILFRALLAKST
jgi:hypothetical protein